MIRMQTKQSFNDFVVELETATRVSTESLERKVAAIWGRKRGK